MRAANVVAVLGSWLVAAAAVQAAPEAGAPNNGSPPPAATPGPAARPLTPAEQTAAARAVVARGNRLSQQVGGLLAEAQRDSDIIRVGCLNDKLTQINANLRNAQKRADAVQSAVVADRRNHEYTVVLVLKRRFEVLEQEANQCVGQELFETGLTRVTTEIDPSKIPNEDPSMIPIVAPPVLPALPPPVLVGVTPPPPPATPQT